MGHKLDQAKVSLTLTEDDLLYIRVALNKAREIWEQDGNEHSAKRCKTLWTKLLMTEVEQLYR